MMFWRTVLVVAAVQSSVLPAEQLIRLPRPLQPDEVAAVLAASRAAVAGKTFTFNYVGGTNGLQVLMREDGWPKIVRGEGGMSGGMVSASGESTHWSDYFVHVVEYTGRRARTCDGPVLADELVVTYEHTRSTDAWTAVAGTRGWSLRGFPAGVPPGSPVFDVLAGRVPVESARGPRLPDGPAVRAFTAAFPLMNTFYGMQEGAGSVQQILWIDVDSLLPVQWEVMQADKVTDTRVLTYTPLDLAPPPGVRTADCIPGSR